MSDTTDPFGKEYGDWEDPQYEHDYCTGCEMCAPWEGRTYEQIRNERLVTVVQRRNGKTERP